ncbi:hypothetical protein BGX30_005054 [Mortierella sp. GBA39]|nr:hypothetical protein BGX30_005054 [Mortierella sp. GBA39]
MAFVCYCGASTPGRSVFELHRSFCVTPAPEIEMIFLSHSEIVEQDALLDESLFDTEPTARPSDHFDLWMQDVDVDSLRRCDETSPLSSGYMVDDSEDSSGDDTDVTLPPIQSPSLPGETPFHAAGQDIDPPFFASNMHGSNSSDLRTPPSTPVKMRRSERPTEERLTPQGNRSKYSRPCFMDPTSRNMK